MNAIRQHTQMPKAAAAKTQGERALDFFVGVAGAAEAGGGVVPVFGSVTVVGGVESVDAMAVASGMGMAVGMDASGTLDVHASLKAVTIVLTSL